MARETRPNVLLICTDHWRGSALGAEGHPCAMTPTLDQLARNGVRFTRAYSASPICIPARRTLMTGTTAKTHGDRVFSERLPMPAHLPTMPQLFRNAGYQAYAVGKLHVYPQRDRIGFDDVILFEEGRHHLGMGADDWEMDLAERGYPGQEMTHAMGNNEYAARPWHLPEELHPTNWLVREMCRTIKRRDPTRPAFWYLSFNHPHPPLVPLEPYMAMYDGAPIPDPCVGEWAGDFDALPYALKVRRDKFPLLKPFELRRAQQAYLALCTHIDHQIRLVIGLLQEEGILDNTVICFTSDHGDMLGNHNLFAKGLFYEDACRIPLIIVPTSDYRSFGHHVEDDRLVELRDVMPTLLDMAGIEIPETVEGMSLLSGERREYLYGEYGEGPLATRTVIEERYKLIYYPTGNRVHLFDLEEDPLEMRDLSAEPGLEATRERLVRRLIGELYGDDLNWLRDGRLVGLPDKAYEPQPNRGLSNQRGWRFMD